VTARFKHEAFAYPIELTKKVLSLFIYGVAIKAGTTFSYKSNGIATSVSVNASECLLVGHAVKIEQEQKKAMSPIS
jgi:hypothetical protein